MKLDEVVRSREVVSLAELAEMLASDPVVIQQSLDGCVREGKIERLQPVTASSQGVEARAVFYRWRRPSDADYLWQRQINAPYPRENRAAAMAVAGDERPLPLTRLLRICLQSLIS